MVPLEVDGGLFPRIPSADSAREGDMNAMVGACVEDAPVRRIVHPVDAAAMLVLLLIATALHGWIVAHAKVTARDSLRFARTALNLEHPNVKADQLGEPHRGAID